jgi:hypothetical protein
MCDGKWNVKLSSQQFCYVIQKNFGLKDNLKTSRNDLPKGVMSFGIQGQRGFPEIFLNKAVYPDKA